MAFVRHHGGRVPLAITSAHALILSTKIRRVVRSVVSQRHERLKGRTLTKTIVAEQLGDVIPNFYNTDKGGVNSTWTCCGADTNDNVFCDRPQGANFTALATDQLYATAAILQNPIRVSALPAAVIASASASVAAKDASIVITATNTVSATAPQSSVATSNQSTLPASGTNAVAGVQASPSQTSSSQTSSTAQASAAHALSPAAIAGIIFGIIALLSLIAAGFFLVYRIGQAKAQKGKRTEAETSAFSSQEKGGEMYMHPQKQLSEMSDDQRPFEMGDGYCAELATPSKAKQTHQKQASVGIEQYLKMKL